MTTLRRFFDREGHTDVPPKWVEDGFPLGNWVRSKRNDRGREQLDTSRTKRLEEFSGWSWETSADSFDEGIKYVRRFADREGHARIPAKWIEEEFALGQWINNRRVDKKSGRLAPERVAQLEQIPGWRWDELLHRFEEGISSMRRFAEREGHTIVAARWVEDGFPLGTWVSGQRRQHNIRRMEADRIARFEEIPGWTWDAEADRLNHGLVHLRSFVSREGHSRVPARWVEDGFPLGNWVGTRRAEQRSGHLAREWAARLAELPGWTWNAPQAQFDDGIAYLERFVEREGHARVARSWVEDGFSLGGWVGDRRNEMRRGRLRKDRAVRLEQLQGWTWDPHEFHFAEGARLLEQYVSREGHAQVTQSWVEDGFPLSNWAVRQRREHKAGRLSNDRFTRLSQIPGWEWKS